MPGAPAAATPPYAGFGSRLGAFVIDGLVGMAVSIPLIIAAFIIGAAGPKQDYTSTDAEGITTTSRGPAVAMVLLLIAVVLLVLLAFTVWNYVIRVGRTGQSIGKKVMGIRVVGIDGQPIGTGRAVGRWLFAGFISGNFCYLGYLWCLWDKQKQTWHDKISNSIVVTVPK